MTPPAASRTGEGGAASAELALAGQVVERVRRAAGPAAQAEVFVEHTAEALTRFANSAIHQNVAEATTTVHLRLHRDGRTVGVAGTGTGPAGLDALVERALAAARHCPPDPEWPGLAAPAPLLAEAPCDEQTASADPAQRAERVRAFVDAADGLVAAGYCRTLYRAGAFANTAGQSMRGATAEAAMDGIARAGDADGVARLSSVRLAELDGARLGATAAAKARAGVDPAELPPGRYEVVLEPGAVVDILENLAGYGFNGKAYAERRSFAEPGERQFDPAVTIVDDVAGAAGGGLPFDPEGTPRQRVVLVEAGITRAVTHDRRTAVRVGAASTGHGTGEHVWGPVPVNVSLSPRPDGPPQDGAAGPAGGDPTGPAADAATAALLAGVRRGLLVTDFWYTRVLDPKSLVVTGLTRNGVWLVEDGEVTRPVRNLRFTQSYPAALAPGAVLAVGARATALPERWGRSRWSAPPLRLAGWHFTGGASG